MWSREIVVENLVKHYPGDVVAVDGVSFGVTGGQIFGFLGPNGAGRSTTIKILTTLALPTAGHASVGGYDVVVAASHVRRIAIVAGLALATVTYGLAVYALKARTRRS